MRRTKSPCKPRRTKSARKLRRTRSRCSRRFVFDGESQPLVRVVNGKPGLFRIRETRLPEEVEGRLGVTTEECRQHYEARLYVNAAYYRELEKHVPDRFRLCPRRKASN